MGRVRFKNRERALAQSVALTSHLSHTPARPSTRHTGTDRRRRGGVTAEETMVAGKNGNGGGGGDLEKRVGGMVAELWANFETGKRRSDRSDGRVCRLE